MTNPYDSFSDELDAIINETPERAAGVAAMVEAIDEQDRIYQMNLAAARKAGELAERDVSERNASLFGSLNGYLSAAGVDEVALSLTVGGKQIGIPLSAILNHS